MNSSLSIIFIRLIEVDILKACFKSFDHLMILLVFLSHNLISVSFVDYQIHSFLVLFCCNKTVGHSKMKNSFNLIT